MSTRAEQMADEAAGRVLAQHAAVYKAAGIAMPTRAELAAIMLPVVEPIVPVVEGAEELNRSVQKSTRALQKNYRKFTKELRQQDRMIAAISTPASAVPLWGRGPR